MTGLLLLALVVGQTVPDFKSALTPESKNLLRTYSACLRASALELERSGATFEEIWKAATTACASKWADALDKIETDFAVDDPQHALSRADDMLERGMEPTKDDMRLKILQLRARRQSGTR